MTQQRTVRIGVVGIGRGLVFIEQSTAEVGIELVALCDTWEERLDEINAEHGVATYTDYDEFLQHDMDAVVLANYFHQHAPFAIKALQAGKHVMSETAACMTMAEGVALVREVERSGLVYMLADQYPFMAVNQEMKRLFEEGTVGDFRYGEGEYVHPMSADFLNGISPGVDHWRNWLPATYYCSHALAPVMHITGTTPKTVNGFVVPYDAQDAVKARTARRMDTAGMIVVTMDNGALVKLLQFDLRGGGNWVRIHGNRGLMENTRTGGHHGQDRVRIAREVWEKPEGVPEELIYKPDFPEHNEQASKSSHFGGDFFMNLIFADAVRAGVSPFFDVYRGVEMAAVGILSYRSALAGGVPIEVPDFRDEAARAAYADDHWSPDPVFAGPGQPAPSVLGHIEPPAAGLAEAKKVWADKEALVYGAKVYGK